MPLLSKARLIGKPKDEARDVKEFSYGGDTTSGAGELVLPGPLPPGTETLWGSETAGGAVSGQEKSFGEDEVRELERQAWQKGFEEASAQGRQNLERALASERAALAAALCEFAQGREAYYQQMETEVVRLVLSIARKVLHREAQVDPMLLRGVVRVALEQLAGGTSVRLRVPPIQADAWRAALRTMPADDLTVEVVADDTLSGPRCLILTEMGTTDVSLSAQLNEIESGFLDLLKQRPGTAPEGREDQIQAARAV